MQRVFFIIALWAFHALPFAETAMERDSALLNPPPHSQWGYAVMDAKTGEVLAQGNAHRFMTPASVVKLIATAFALDRMDAERRFPTVLYRTGRIENGALRGDLWIRGGGNPALGDERADSSQRSETVFAIFTRALEQAGIHEVDGNVHGDGGLIPSQGPERGALWEDVGNYYGTVPSGLCFHDNAYSLLMTARRDSSLAILETRPLHIGVSRFQIMARNAGSPNGDSCFILGAFWNTPRVIAGSCPVGEKPLELKGSLPDPAWTCARNYEDFLNLHGIAVKSRDNGRSQDPLPRADTLPSDTVRLAEHDSPPLIDLIASLHHNSDNLYAAQLVALSGGLPALRDWLDAQTPYASEFHLVDGNGLSLQDNLTPGALTQLLVSCAARPWFPAWRESLIGGTAHPFKTAAFAEGLRGKLWIKTGSMTGVAALSGIFRRNRGACWPSQSL